MESHGEHKRDKSLLIFWIFIGISIGGVIGASTHEWLPSIAAGIIMGVLMALFATKRGLDQ